MKKYIILAFLIIICSLSGCANQTNLEITNKTDTEYEPLLKQYYEILLKYNETPIIDQFEYLEDEAIEKFQNLLNYRESLLEEYPSEYELYYDVPGIRIRFSEIYTCNDDNYRYVTYIPSVSNTSKVFIQSWNDDIFECVELLAAKQSPSTEYEVVDTRILSDDSGVYANILIKATDITFWEDSYRMCTYKIENGTFTNFIPIKGALSAGNWTVEKATSFDTDFLSVEIRCNKEKEIGEWFNAGYGFEVNVFTFFEVGGGNEFQLVFENGIWDKKV